MSYKNPNTVQGPRGTTSVRSQFISPAATVLAGIETVDKAIEDRTSKVRTFETEAGERRSKAMQDLKKTEGMQKNDKAEQLRQQLMEQIDEAYKLDIKSFGGNRSEYLAKEKEINSYIDQIPKLMGIIDKDGEKFKQETDKNKNIKRNRTPEQQLYYEFVKDASEGGDNIGFVFKDGDIVAQLNGKDVFNGRAYIKNKADGFDLVEYRDSYDKELEDTFKQYKVGLEEKVREYQVLDSKGKLKDIKQKEYNDVRKQMKKRLENSQEIEALINESNFQAFVPGNGVFDPNNSNQKAQTKEAMIEYLLDQYLPGTQIVNVRSAEEKTKQGSGEGEESTIDEDGFDASAKGYIDRKSVQISTAIDANNKKGLTDVITTELSSATGVDPQVEFDGDNLVITTSKSTGGKAYTAEQAKIINENAGTTLINDKGEVVDEEGFKAYKEQNAVDPPTGNAIQKPGEQIVIDNYKSPKGQAQLLNVLGRNRFGQKNRNEALFEVEKLTKKAEEDLLSGNRAKGLKARDQQTLKAIRNDAKFQSSNTQQVDLDNPGTQFTKEAVQFFNSLPKDFKIETFDDGVITVEEYLAKPSVKLGDLYNHYANAFEVVSQDRTKYPDAYMGYTMLDTQRRDIQNKKKKLDPKQ